MKNITLLLNFQNCSFVSPRKLILNFTREVHHTLGEQWHWREYESEVTFRVHVSSLMRFPFYASLSLASLLLLVHGSPVLNKGRNGDLIKFHSKWVNNPTPPIRLSQDEAWTELLLQQKPRSRKGRWEPGLGQRTIFSRPGLSKHWPPGQTKPCTPRQRTCFTFLKRGWKRI